MFFSRVIFMLLAALALLGIAGCYGPAPSLDPTVTFSFPEDTTLPYLPSGTLLHIVGEAEVSDASTNPIIGYTWTQEPPVGQFVTTTSLETVWAAPTLNSGDAPLPVTLTLETETLQGGKSVEKLHLIILPPDTP